MSLYARLQRWYGRLSLVRKQQFADAGSARKLIIETIPQKKVLESLFQTTIEDTDFLNIFRKADIEIRKSGHFRFIRAMYD